MGNFTAKLVIKPGHPDFTDLPWSSYLSDWRGICTRLEEVNQGVSRHPVVFVNYAGTLYALKELPPDVAEREFNALQRLASLHLPAVTPVGFAIPSVPNDKTSVLITQFLENSIPYRSLFMSPGLTAISRKLAGCNRKLACPVTHCRRLLGGLFFIEYIIPSRCKYSAGISGRCRNRRIYETLIPRNSLPGSGNHARDRQRRAD